MDKRKLKTTKSSDGNTTITQNRFGSGYKKESILLNTSTVVVDSADLKDAIESINKGYDPVQLIGAIERIILRFLKDNDLPTEDFQKGVPKSEGGTGFTFRSLSLLLKEDYAYVIGATEASSCLFEISSCKDDLRKSNYKLGMVHSLRLVLSFQRFTFAILEPTLALGKSHQDNMIGNNTKLSNEQYEQCFKYFESLNKTKDDTRKLGIGEKWSKTEQHALEKYNVKISTQSLSKAYKVRNS